MRKWKIFLKYISAPVKNCFHINHINLLYGVILIVRKCVLLHFSLNNAIYKIDMVDIKAILHWGTNTFQENISFPDFPDL